MYLVMRLEYNDFIEYVIYIFKVSYIILCNLSMFKNVFSINKICCVFNIFVYIEMVIYKLYLMYMSFIVVDYKNIKK